VGLPGLCPGVVPRRDYQRGTTHERQAILSEDHAHDRICNGYSDGCPLSNGEPPRPSREVAPVLPPLPVSVVSPPHRPSRSGLPSWVASRSSGLPLSRA
jgi:hypothetical protein